jgi:hypothetical protein
LNWISIGPTNDGTEFIRTQRRRIRSPKNANQMKDEEWAFIFVYLYYIYFCIVSRSFIRLRSPLASQPARNSIRRVTNLPEGKWIEASFLKEVYVLEFL